MDKIVDFIKECGTFFVLTVNGDCPAGRPFGAIMEYKNHLYISTADTKAVYMQLKENENMQIVALKPGTRQWIRVSGIATECCDLNIKQKMLDECLALRKHYNSAESAHYSIFQIEVTGREFN